MHSYVVGLLAAIAAPDASDKDAVLVGLTPPANGTIWIPPVVPHRPGRPAHVIEGSPTRRRKGVESIAGLRRFLHAIWHIELEAIDLACLMALRGPNMPQAFHADCLRVAREEAEHAQLLAAWLRQAGWPPGSEPVHHRLWDAARTCEGLGEQLVAVPRFLEARGLDVNAGLLPRVEPVDAAAHVVLKRIYNDEINHVATGTHWHRHWCTMNGLDPETHFIHVIRHRFAEQIPSPWPLDVAGRTQAGFSKQEMGAVGS
ncbi:MAG: DUF455 family protein [Planctomycetota bacterium]